MAQSRVQKGNGNKSKFPTWGVAILVILVVAIAGYAIVRFSHAGGSGGTTYIYPFSNIQGSNGAYKTKISKTNGGTVDAWALPNGAFVYAGTAISAPYGGNVNSCIVAQRLSGAIGQANIGATSYYTSGSAGGALKTTNAMLNIGVAKQYCSGDINTYLSLPSPYNNQIKSAIVNNSNSILYVTQMSISY